MVFESTSRGYNPHAFLKRWYSSISIIQEQNKMPEKDHAYFEINIHMKIILEKGPSIL
jgi:hypothetical protein